jgi:ABC-type amino acid transport substrate-binding protein
MNNKVGYAALVIGLLGLALVLFRPAPSGEGALAKKETAFERVMRTGTLRCAYIPRAHHFIIDSAANQKSGIDHDVMEAIGKLLHIKIDWVEETGYGSYPEQLNSGKEDALCVTVWTSVARAARVLYTSPVIYSPLYAYVRDGDTRFDGKLESLNDEKITLSVIDGGTVKAIADTSFPKAKLFALPGLSDDPQQMLSVVTGKGDASFFDEMMIGDYNKLNPEKKLRRVAGVPPVRTYPETFSVAMGEFELRELLSAAIAELHNNGTINRILTRYENVPGEIMRVVPPYASQVEQEKK